MTAHPPQSPAENDASVLLAAENLAFVRSSMVYLILAGIVLATHGSLLPDVHYRTAVLHALTLGFMLLLIFGLGAHMLPRFTGQPIRLGVWSWVQFGLAHAGIGSFLLGFVVERPGLSLAGGSLVWLAFALFALRLWPVLRAAQTLR